MSLEIVHDIETKSMQAPAAVILTIGAVLVDTDDGRITDSFYRRLSSVTQPYRESDRETMNWWENQSFAARAEAFGRERHPAPDILIEYNEWLQRVPTAGIWGNGAAFDNAILQHAFAQVGIKWPYWRDRCLRNLRGMVGGDKLPWPDGLTKHIAIDDAIYEAAELTELLRRWKSSTFTIGAEAMRDALLRMFDDEIKQLTTTLYEIPESNEYCRQSIAFYRALRADIVGINLADSGVTS